MIKLSIITICYNDLKNLKATYESILNKPNFVDWYVVDGNSNDGTQTFLESQSLTSGFVSENDNGIADAFNKGIELIEEKDSFVLFLNAGDTLCCDFFENYPLFCKSTKKVYVGKILFSGHLIGKVISSQRQKLRNYLPHQGMVIGFSLFEKYGYYDQNFRYGMDYEWSLRILPDWKEHIRFVDKCFSIMDPNGISVTNYKKTFLYYHKARLKNNSLNKFFSFMIYKFYSWRRYLSQAMRSA